MEHGGDEKAIDHPLMNSGSSESNFDREGGSQSGSVKASSFNQTDLFEALEVVERDSLAIADSFNSLFASLRLALSEVTGTSIDHMQCFSDAAGRLQESAIEAAARGNRFISSCIRLNEEMKGIDGLAVQLKILRKNVDTLDSTVNRLLRIT
ncbi:hypothetical protein Ancab_032674 [Ancistrocladus abbreviatus]